MMAKEPKMLVARELLKLINSMVIELRDGGQVAVPEATVNAQYIAIVCMLRSVGHVLQKADCTSESEKKFLASLWPTWKSEAIFETFIEPARNDLLKEFKNRLRLRGDGIDVMAYANPNDPSGATLVVTYEPDDLSDIHDRKVMPLFKQAIEFWEKNLKEIEAFRASALRP